MWITNDASPGDGIYTAVVPGDMVVPDQVFDRFEDYQGRMSLRYATADRMRSSCVSCHNSHPDSTKRDWKVGDVRGVLEIIRPLDRDVARTRAGLRMSFILVGVVSS